MRKIGLILLFATICLLSCKKELEFRTGNYYLTGNATYTYGSQNYPVNIYPVNCDSTKMVLINSDNTSLEFFIRTTSSWGEVSDKTLFLERENDIVSGTFVPDEGSDFLLTGFVFKENHQKKIQGVMSFTTTHETVFFDGTYTYPVSYSVIAHGTFKIEPE